MTDEALGLDDNAAELRRQLEVQLREGDMQEIMGQLAHIIGNVSKQLGLVLAPRFEQGLLGRNRAGSSGRQQATARRDDQPRTRQEFGD